MGDGTEIGRVRGLGSARHGARNWLMERLSGLASLIPCMFLAVSLALLPGYDYAAMSSWAASPLVATALALLTIATFWHARLGLIVLIEDYVHAPGNKFAVLTLLNFAAAAGAVFALVCIVRLALGGAA